MGCASHRHVVSDEESTLVEQERKLKYFGQSAVHVDQVLRKYSHEGSVTTAQFAAAAADLHLKVDADGPNSRIGLFYDTLKRGGAFKLNQLLLTGLLLSEGHQAAKAELVYEIYDPESTNVLPAGKVTDMVADLLDISVTKLQVLIGPGQNGPADPTSVNFYIDKLLVHRKSTDDKLAAAILQGKAQITKAEFVAVLGTKKLRHLLTSSGFREYYFKEYKSKAFPHLKKDKKDKKDTVKTEAK